MTASTRAEHLNQRMPLARALITDRQIQKDAVLFDIQVAADIIAQRGGLGVGGFEDLGPIPLPYPVMFVEWHDADLNNMGPGPTGAIGFLLKELDDLEGFSMTQFVLRSDGKVASFFVSLNVLTKNGVVKSIQSAGNAGYDDVYKSQQDFDNMAETMCGIGNAVFMALSLINCRNVKTEVLGKLTMRRSGAQKRRGMKPFAVRYNTIQLPGGGSQRQGLGALAHDRASALHRVRGHFKHFGPEYGAGLLYGKLAGKFWWGWQLRGDPEHGIVESDYQIGDVE